MTSTTQSGTHDLKRVLRLGDLVLFNVVAVLGLRWVATSAKAGPSSLILWLLAALLFFIPQGIAVITLASRFPDEGGVYAWTRRSYGEWNGFLHAERSCKMRGRDMQSRTQRRQYGEPVARLSLRIRCGRRHTLRREGELVSITCSALLIRRRWIHVPQSLSPVGEVMESGTVRPYQNCS